MTMKVRVRYFASLREALGSQEDAEIVAGTTVGTLRDALIGRGGRHAEVLARGRAVRCSLNQAMCGDETVIAEGAEVAFFPPVTGG